jgi:flotillin
MTGNMMAMGPDMISGMAFIIVPALIIFFFLVFVLRQYRRCPSNRILVVYGRVAGARAARCLHGGGVFVVPLFQDYAYLSLEPLTIDIELNGALSKMNIRVNVPSTFTVGISTQPEIMNNAAERLLGLMRQDIETKARDIILGQLRLVIATLSIEEINQDREKFLDLVNKNVNYELNKVGLEVINVNIRDITDESGYIEAIGKKAAAAAIQQAKIEVAQQERMGAIGESTATREREVSVAEQGAQSQAGQKQAERDRRVAVSKFEAEGVAGESAALREKEIAQAEQKAKAVQGQKQAETEQRIRVAVLEAEAVKGENESRAQMAAYQATLQERQAEAQRRGGVASASAAADVLLAEKQEEIARLEKMEVAQKEIDKRKIEIEAEAEAERQRRIARGQADATLARYTAEAEGVQKVLQAKAQGYEELLKVCTSRPEIAPTLLLIEKLPDLVAQQVKAIQNLRIDRITVWDSGNDGAKGSSTAGFLKSLIGSLPPIHDLAQQAGVKLPDVFGSVADGAGVRPADGGERKER